MKELNRYPEKKLFQPKKIRFKGENGKQDDTAGKEQSCGESVTNRRSQ